MHGRPSSHNRHRGLLPRVRSSGSERLDLPLFALQQQLYLRVVKPGELIVDLEVELTAGWQEVRDTRVYQVLAVRRASQTAIPES